jgi:hypothetical protein
MFLRNVAFDLWNKTKNNTNIKKVYSPHGAQDEIITPQFRFPFMNDE